MRGLPPARNDQSSIERMQEIWKRWDAGRGVICEPVAAVILQRCVKGIPGEADRVHHIVSQSRDGIPQSQTYILGGQRARLMASRGRLKGIIQLPLGITLSDNGLKLSRRRVPESQIQCILKASEKRARVGEFIQTGIPELDEICMEPSTACKQRRDYAMVILRTPQSEVPVR